MTYRLTASFEDRIISGTAAIYNVIGNASTGRTEFASGALSLPAPLSKCKFLEEHDKDRPIGFAISDVHVPQKDLVMSFSVAEGPRGDQAIADARAGIRDGLSVGLMITGYYYRESDGVLVVTAAQVKEVSLVTIPAFENTLVSTASLEGEQIMTQQVKVLTASTPEAPAAAPAAPAVAPAATLTAASVSQELPPQAQGSTAQRTAHPQAMPMAASHAANTGLKDLANLTAAHFKANSTGGVATLTAALTDLLPSDDAGEGYLRPQWVGEVWTAAREGRPTIDSLGPIKELKGMKMRGFKRDRSVAGKIVNKFTGNKTDVPTSAKYKTKLVEADAGRWAGGFDVDRIYVDLGDGTFMQDVYMAAAEDYRDESEADVLDQMVEASTVLPAVPTVVAALTDLGIAAAGIGASLTKIQFGTEAWKAFINLNAADAPWWLQKQGDISLSGTSGNAGGLTFNVNPSLPADTMEAHDARAATVHEEPLFRIQAENIPKGGVDLGVFAYGGLMINDARAIWTIKVTPPAEV